MLPISSRKHVILGIRLLVGFLIALFIFIGPESGFPAYGFPALYMLTSLAIAVLPDRIFHKDKVIYGLMFIDSILLPAGIHFSGNAGTDLYLVYFPVVFLAALSVRIGFLFINTLTFSAFYILSMHQEGFAASDYLPRILFIIGITMIYGLFIAIRMRDKDNWIREVSERYEQIVQATDVLMSIVDQEGNLLFTNHKFAEMYGQGDEMKILGLSYSDFQTPGNSENFLDYVEAVYKTKGTVPFEAYDLCNDRWFTNTLSPIRNPDTDDVFAVCVISKDITERITKEKELNETVALLKRTRDQLLQKDKMAALGRMASGIAHEIRNPLEIITMGMDFLVDYLPRNSPDIQKAADKIYNAVDRANNIIKDVLSFSKQTKFEIKTVALRPLLDNTLSLAGHTIRKNGVTVDHQYRDKQMMVSADSNMLQQVILNLVNNAVDAMQNSEKKQLTIRTVTQQATEIDYKTGLRQADYFRIGDELVVIEISDTGSGIPEDILPNIFEPFFTTKTGNEGTGLGLSLAHMIMERLNGTISVESLAGKGTRFFVKLQIP